jgi:hypothetical protein
MIQRAIPFLIGAVLGLSAAGVTTSATAATQVVFVEPERFTDVPFSPHDREEVLARLEKHFKKLGDELPAGQNLKVEVLDIDLAGREHPSPAATGIRILRGRADYPALTFRYTIEAAGKTLQSGQERLIDLNYLQGVNAVRQSEPLFYEKRMLDRWFRARGS